MSYQIQEFNINNQSAFINGVDLTLSENFNSLKAASCQSINTKYYEVDKDGYFEYKNKKIKYLTIHASKGLEADQSIEFKISAGGEHSTTKDILYYDFIKSDTVNIRLICDKSDMKYNVAIIPYQIITN